MKIELAFLLHKLSDLYRKPCLTQPTFEEVDIFQLLLLAINNNIGYYISKKLLTEYMDKLDKKLLSLIKIIVKRGDAKFECIQHTLQWLKSYLNDDYLLFKTYRRHVRIGNDVDVLVHNFKKVVRKLKTKIELVDYSAYERKAVFIKNGVKIHLHGNISWTKKGTTFLDKELVWDNPRTVSIGRVHVKIPNVNAELLIYLAHLNYENLYITLSDLLYIYELARYVDWSIILKQASKHHWEKTLRYSICLLDMIHHTIYSGPCPFLEWSLKHQGFNSPKLISFPKPLPRIHIILAFIEKKLLTWVLCNRVLKSIKILVSGNTYRSFHVPPEISLIT